MVLKIHSFIYSYFCRTLAGNIYKSKPTKQKKKIPKHIWKVKLHNKALELIELPWIFNLPEVVF